MARNKTPEKKELLTKVNNTRKKAPVWVFAKTKRKVRGGPQSHKTWQNSSVF